MTFSSLRAHRQILSIAVLVLFEVAPCSLGIHVSSPTVVLARERIERYLETPLLKQCIDPSPQSLKEQGSDGRPVPLSLPFANSTQAYFALGDVLWTLFLLVAASVEPLQKTHFKLYIPLPTIYDRPLETTFLPTTPHCMPGTSSRPVASVT
jgi:hypothetical protein